MPAGYTCTLRIVRHSGYADRLRSYIILVDGKPVGTIARNSVLDLEVPAGPRTIEARIDWARSRPLTTEAVPNRTIEVQVSNDWNPILALWAITFGAGNYLTLKQLPSA
jgi:hypothetical protein